MGCSGNVRLKPQLLLRILWMGRSGSLPVHPSVRGQQMIDVHHADISSSKGNGSAGGRVSVAVALLGTLCCMARWFSVTHVDLLALDKGSGKLVEYLKQNGFMLAAGKPMDPDNLWLEA